MKLLIKEILSNEKYGENIYKMEVFSPDICKNAQAGQFINVKCSSGGNIDPLLRRPFSIFDVEKKFNVFSILYTIKGKGTKFLTSLKNGDNLDFAGPLGKGIDLDGKNINILLVGGGIGIAPLNFIAGQAQLKNKNPYLVAGFKDSNFLRWERDLVRTGIKYRIFTEDGSWGETGLATDYLKEDIFAYKDYDIYCCGPVSMLKQLQNIFKDTKNNVSALLEETMACGIGVCMGCVIKIRTGKNKFKYKRVCSEGPAFDLREVIFD